MHRVKCCQQNANLQHLSPSFSEVISSSRLAPRGHFNRSLRSSSGRKTRGGCLFLQRKIQSRLSTGLALTLLSQCSRNWTVRPGFRISSCMFLKQRIAFSQFWVSARGTFTRQPRFKSCSNCVFCVRISRSLFSIKKITSSPAGQDHHHCLVFISAAHSDITSQVCAVNDETPLHVLPVQTVPYFR